MCIFCAAIPIAATTGIALNAKQLEAKKKNEEVEINEENPESETPKAKPIMPMTAGVVALLMVGSAAYHILTFLP